MCRSVCGIMLGASYMAIYKGSAKVRNFGIFLLYQNDWWKTPAHFGITKCN